MKLTERQVTALHHLADTSVISADQERAVRAALDVPDRSGSRSELLLEVLGYVGGGLLLGGAALVVGTSWDDLTRVGRFSLVAAATVVLVVAGVLIAGGPRAVPRLAGGSAPVRHRIVGVLFALAAATAAITGGVAADTHEAPIGSATGLVVAVAGYAVLPTAIGLLASAALSFVLVTSLLAETLEAPVLNVGLSLFGLGVAWFGLAVGRALRHRSVGLAVGAVIALIGAQQPFGNPEDAVWAYAMTAVLALLCFVVYLREQAVVLLVAGVVATTIVVPEAVWDWTDGAVGGGWLLLVGGTVLLAASGVGLRLRQATGGGRDRGGHSGHKVPTPGDLGHSSGAPGGGRLGT